MVTETGNMAFRALLDNCNNNLDTELATYSVVIMEIFNLQCENKVYNSEKFNSIQFKIY